MMRCRRPSSAPSLLTTHGPTWTERFVARRKADPSASFQWPQHEGVHLNRHLRPALLAMTASHCAYCDHFELGVDGARCTIDHFRPKGDARFWALAYTWENLFPCCDLCQEAKGEIFCETALAPDEASYDFEHYFVVNYRTGEIEPSPAAPPEIQKRARDTCAWLDLNRDRLPGKRRDWYERTYAPRRWFNTEHPPLDELPYRYLAPRGVASPSGASG